MARHRIELLESLLEAAYRGDRWHALAQSLAPLTPGLWHARPAGFSVDVFGTEPELSVADLVVHVGAAKRMYANRAFGDGTARWEALVPAGREMEATLTWLEEGHRELAGGLAALDDDARLQEQRTAHWGVAIPVERFVRIMVNHDLYHSGEINRQLSLLRGASGEWIR